METQLLGLGLSLAWVAAAATRNTNTNTNRTTSFHLPHPHNGPGPVGGGGGGGRHLPNMTYRALDDLHPDDLVPEVESEGQRSFNVVATTTAAAATTWWSGDCQSNHSELWGVTWPVCSTRFTSLVWVVVVTVVLAVITLWTILGNVLVLCALYRYRVLRTMSNCLIGNLAVSDLLLAITVLPISTANDVLGYWVFGSAMCSIWLSIDVLYCTASIWGLCTIAFDRYTATVYPMWYHDKRSPRKALAYMIFVWLFSIVISLAPFIGWRDMISKSYIHDQDLNRYMCILFSTQSYVIYSAMGSFILPLCLMTFLYVQIFVVLHRQADQLKKRPRITRDFSSRVDTDCPTFVMKDNHHVLSRDFTASSFMAENTFVDRGDREGEEEGEEVGEEEDNGDLASPSRPTFGLDDRGQPGEGEVSPGPTTAEESCENPLLDQGRDSLDVVLHTFGKDTPVFSFSRKDLLSVSACDTRAQLPPMKKSQSAAFADFGDKAGHRPRSVNISPPPPSLPPRSLSISTFCPDDERPKDLENGHSGKPLFSVPWSPAASESKNGAMNVSMRRRFQLREQRATKRMLLIMACFFVCWIPFTLMYMLRSLCPKCAHMDDHLTAFIIWLGYVNSSLNPLLYTLFNDDFRKAFKKLLGLYHPRRSSATE
ncbi:octopamine receptor 2-like [Babylonia areolata]|uniref:octopamine receptor 2-like n=1 Tax=Babylonia areolata TaxID=304850 RepID=UPI003FD49AC9